MVSWITRLGQCFVVSALIGVIQAGMLDLQKATVVAPPGLSGPEKKAVAMLMDEVAKRSHIRWSCASAWPEIPAPLIVIGPFSVLKEFAGQHGQDLSTKLRTPGPEGYCLFVTRDPEAPAVFVAGQDSRGVLFGVGRLLRELRLKTGSVAVADDLDLRTSPRYPLRGHQLGYRPKTNSYDAWDLPQWEQYFRDLAVFGCNAIELIPPRSDDDALSPHFPRPPLEMMAGMSKLADEYGLEVWLWYPAMDPDYSDPLTVEKSLDEWSEVYKKLPRVDAVFVPGGDPGHTRPLFLLALLEKQARRLRSYHAQAQMWVSPQGLNQAWMDEFLGVLNHDRPAWLTGLVFGPQVRLSLAQLRTAVPSQYPLRHYPDITHSRQCQYPVPDWDVAYAVTEGRECINPRPEDEAAIFRSLQPHTIGFLTYSEGCNDDVNKILWSALGWDPDRPVIEILREYSRYFIGDAFADDFAQGLLALERNWRGPLLANAGVDITLAQFQSLEKAASPPDLKNWRFQQALFRAYYDAYTRSRLMFESGLEERAMTCLRQAPLNGSLAAMSAAATVLDRSLTEPVAEDRRQRIFELAEALYQSIGMQLSVEKYRAIAVDRGASLDTLDFPLNNRLWLQEQFKRLRQLASEADRLQGIRAILDWTNPGPGGFYDDLGNPARQPHLVRGPGFWQDPASLQSVRAGFEEDPMGDESGHKRAGVRRVSWMDHAESLFDAPLQMRYTGLDPTAHYRLRVVYAGDSPARKIRLQANEGLEIHPFITKPFPFKPVEFDLPSGVTQRGELLLSWYREPGLGGNGRGCQVSEVWLLKK